MKNLILIALSSLLLITCCPTKQACDDSEKVLKIKVFQLNDVYEIDGIEHGNYGNLARVATLINQAKADTSNARVISVLSGDFLSPSIYNTLGYPGGTPKIDDKVNGRQMIETFNSMGLDYVAFGNHEFDLKSVTAIQNRILESEFTWLNANLRYRAADSTIQSFKVTANGKAADMPGWTTDTIRYKGQQILMGLTGLTLDFNGKPDYLIYEDHIAAGRKAMKALRGTDIQLAITHLSKEEDIDFARSVKGMEAIFGGHEHVNYALHANGTPVYKADANARTIYVHDLLWHPRCQKLEIISHLLEVTPEIEKDPKVAAVIGRWTTHQDTSLINMGYQPYDTIFYTQTPLDATEEGIRHQQTNMGRIITDATRGYAPGADAAIINSGSIRLDSYLSGYINELDILKTLPYGGTVVMTRMPGETLLMALTTSETQNQAKGSYLQYSGDISNDPAKGWLLNGQAIKADSTYQIASTYYLMKYGDDNLQFLTDVPWESLPDANAQGLKNDLRDITIASMKAEYQKP